MHCLALEVEAAVSQQVISFLSTPSMQADKQMGIRTETFLEKHAFEENPLRIRRLVSNTNLVI